MPGWVQGWSAAGAVQGPAAVFPVVVSAGAACVSGCCRAAWWWRVPAPTPSQRRRVPQHPQLRLCPGTPEASQELASGRAAIGAWDPRGLASCNLAFTRLQGCKGLNQHKPNLLKGARLL